jgi:hypothetical protein
MFIFKKINNTLSVGARVANYNNDKNLSCCFCTKAKILPPDRENFVHLFWDCPVVNPIIIQFLSVYYPGTGDKLLFFYGNTTEKPVDSFTLAIMDIFKFTIWNKLACGINGIQV